MKAFHNQLPGLDRIRIGLLACGLWPVILLAQVPVQISPTAQAQLQVQQPLVDNSGPVSATANFEPALAVAGQKIFYRVTVDGSQNAIGWPKPLALPDGLKLTRSASGQITRMEGNRFRPQTTFLFELKPENPGSFIVPEFKLDCGGESVTVPAATLVVTTNAVASAQTPARELRLELSATNVFFGQPVRARILLPAAVGNQIDALRDPQLNGDSIMSDKTNVRQVVESSVVNGQLRPAFVYEIRITPFAIGNLPLSAQGFSAGRDFGGPVIITGNATIVGGNPNYTLLLSDEKILNVRALPAEGELPGFTGAMGKFLADAPKLSTNRVRVGEPVHLRFGFHGEGDLTRFVPPEIPRLRDWQVIADNPPGSGFTFIPFSDETTSTPAIPFSAFDPATGSYYDLTIPAFPVTVISEGLPTKLRDETSNEKNSAPLKLGAPSVTPGRTAASLKPLQLNGWFVLLQLLPAYGLFLLWRWDERRRFLEAHPEIARRQQAKRFLKQERKRIRRAVNAGDEKNFTRHALAAMQIAAAPHFPANPSALVQADVLSLLSPAERVGSEGDMVRRIFLAVNAKFGRDPAASLPLDLVPEIEGLLKKLEAKL